MGKSTKIKTNNSVPDKTPTSTKPPKQNPEKDYIKEQVLSWGNGNSPLKPDYHKNYISNNRDFY